MDHTLVLLQVKNLHTVFHSEHGDVQAVRGVSFQVNKGETLGIIGESGCGKSATAMSVCCMLAKNGEITDGKILLHGENLRKKSAKEIRNLRAKAISTIFQDSLTSLDPLMPIGKQIAEVVRYHERVTWKDAEKKALEMLARVGFQDVYKRQHLSLFSYHLILIFFTEGIRNYPSACRNYSKNGIDPNSCPIAGRC